MSKVDDNGYTPLCHAVSSGHLEVVKYLSNCVWPEATGSGTAIKSDSIQTAFVLCASKGYDEIALFLLEKLQESSECHIDTPDSLSGETGESNLPHYFKKFFAVHQNGYLHNNDY